MWQNAHDTYVESRILSADGLELVRLLYQGCTSAVRDARRHLEAGEIRARSQSITKAWEILAELAHSLDRERGGEIAGRLADLYDYMQRRLLDANLQQADGPLAEVLGLLSTLSEAWEGIETQSQNPAPATENPWGQALPQESGAEYTEHRWSLAG
jgi:flagellar secretion chaperone FliS